MLHTRGIRNLVLTGITTDVCVHTTMREANDRGFECLIVSDGTGATDRGNHDAALKMVTMQGGVFGAVAVVGAMLEAWAILSMTLIPPPHEPTGAARVEMLNFSKRFGALQALDDVSMTVEAGSFHALLGENGAGKSTLVKSLIGFYQRRHRQRDGRRPRAGHPQPARRRGAGPGHDLPALHRGAGHERGREPGAGAARPGCVHRLEGRARAARRSSCAPRPSR